MNKLSGAETARALLSNLPPMLARCAVYGKHHQGDACLLGWMEFGIWPRLASNPYELEPFCLYSKAIVKVTVCVQDVHCFNIYESIPECTALTK